MSKIVCLCICMHAYTQTVYTVCNMYNLYPDMQKVNRIHRLYATFVCKIYHYCILSKMGHVKMAHAMYI